MPPSPLTTRELSAYRSSTPSRSFIVTPTYRLFALAARMSWPCGGVFAVTVGSNSESKNIGRRRSSSASSVSPARSGNRAPARAAARAAAANASGVHASTNLRSEEHTSELQSRFDLVCRLLLEKKKKKNKTKQ